MKITLRERDPVLRRPGAAAMHVAVNGFVAPCALGLRPARVVWAICRWIPWCVVRCWQCRGSNSFGIDTLPAAAAADMHLQQSSVRAHATASRPSRPLRVRVSAAAHTAGIRQEAVERGGLGGAAAASQMWTSLQAEILSNGGPAAAPEHSWHGFETLPLACTPCSLSNRILASQGQRATAAAANHAAAPSRLLRNALNTGKSDKTEAFNAKFVPFKDVQQGKLSGEEYTLDQVQYRCACIPGIPWVCSRVAS